VTSRKLKLFAASFLRVHPRAGLRPDLGGRTGRGLTAAGLIIPIFAFGAAVLLTTPPAWASGSSMPWEQPLNQILESIQGPVAKVVAVLVIITTGLALAFGDTSGGFRRLIQIVFGLSIAFAASSFFLSFFSFGGGALVA
jgi:type IV secretory pathway VirB2 component (pilin)